MEWLRELLSGVRGSALIFTLLVLTVLLVVSTALLTMAQVETQIVKYQYKDLAAFYVAEAGLQLAACYLEHDPGFRGMLPASFIPAELTGDSSSLAVTIKETTTDGLLQVTSIGELDGVKSTLESDLWVVEQQFILEGEETVLSAGDIEINLGVDGSMPNVAGLMGYNHYIKIDTMNCQLNYEQNNPPLDLSCLPLAAFRLLAERTISLLELPSILPLQGIVYLDGDLLIDAHMGFAGSGILIVAGEVVLDNASLPGKFYILAEKDVKILGHTSITGVILTPARVVISNGGVVTGRIIAGKEVKLCGNVEINMYDGPWSDLLFGLPEIMVLRDNWYGRKYIGD
ncbi:MAG: polymer-forming cytoskeletal protein [bacterium]|jgi:hypothetical protein